MPGTDITVRDMADTIITKTRDMSPEMKAIYRKGAIELHPDTSGLPDSYFVKFNEATARGDLNSMNSILNE